MVRQAFRPENSPNSRSIHGPSPKANHLANTPIFQELSHPISQPLQSQNPGKFPLLRRACQISSDPELFCAENCEKTTPDESKLGQGRPRKLAESGQLVSFPEAVTRDFQLPSPRGSTHIHLPQAVPTATIFGARFEVCAMTAHRSGVGSSPETWFATACPGEPVTPSNQVTRQANRLNWRPETYDSGKSHKRLVRLTSNAQPIPLTHP